MGKIDDFLENLRKKNISSYDDKKAILKKSINQIHKGEFKLKDTRFKFKNELFLGGKIEIPVPVKFFDVEINDGNRLVLSNKEVGVSLKIDYFKQGSAEKTIEEVRDDLTRDFKDSKVSLKWIEGGECGKGNSKLSYGTYKNSIDDKNIYNAIIYKERRGNLILGKYTCNYNDINIWENIIKASIMLIKLNR